MIFEPLFLTIKNFMNHSFSEIDFSNFNSCLIIGREKYNDRRSNGSGKSTIFHAINYVLFNVFPTKTMEKIVRDGQDLCEVSIIFLADDKKYRITRKRSNKSNKSEVLLEDLSIDSVNAQKIDSRTKTDTEADIKKILKVNFETFNSSVLFQQGSFSDLAEGTPAKKKAALKGPLDLSVYLEYEKLAKKKLTAIENEINSRKSIVNSIGNPEEDIKLSKDQIKLDKKVLTSNEESLKDIKSKISYLQSDNEKLNSLLGSDAMKVSETLSFVIKNKEKTSNELKNLLQESSKNKSNIQSLKSKIAILNEELVKNNNLLDQFKDLKFKSEEEINQKISELSDKEIRGNKYIALIESDIEKYSKPLPEGSTCEVCFNNLNEEYRVKISESNKQLLIDKKIEFEKSKVKLNSIIDLKLSLNKELKEIAKNQANILNISNQIVSISKDIASNNALIGKYQEMFDSSMMNIDEKENELKNFLEEEDLLRKQVESFNIKDINDKLLNNNSQISNLLSEEKNIIKNITIVSSDIGANSKKLEIRQEDLVKLKVINEELSLYNSKFKLLSKVAKAFSPSGIPTLIIHTILEDLQIESNKVLKEIRPEFSLQFSVEKEDKESLDIHYFLNGKERDYEQLSGGQKTYISFALKLGISQVIQNIMDVRFKFLELDEVDQALDEEGKDAFIEVVKKIQDRYKILIITHDYKMKSRLPHHLIVENDGDNGATVKFLGE